MKRRMTVRAVAAAAAVVMLSSGTASAGGIYWLGEPCVTHTHGIVLAAAGTGGPGGEDVRVPGRVRDFYALPGNRSAWLQWRVPADDGGSYVVGFQVRQWRIVRGEVVGLKDVETARTQRQVKHLKNGRKYRFAVRAANERGWGPWSRTHWVVPGPQTLP